MNAYCSYYKAISQNINITGRLLQYLLHLSSNVAENKENYAVLNSNARFWNDYKFMTIQSIIIILGKIFDPGPKTYNINLLMKNLRSNLDHFSKANLRARKISLGVDDSLLDEILNRCHELTIEDVKEISKKVREARKIWKKIEPLRQKFYAHHEDLSDEEITNLHKNVQFKDLENIIQILLDVCFALEMAELNGRKPDFKDNKNSRPIHIASREIEILLSTLVRGHQTNMKTA